MSKTMVTNIDDFNISDYFEDKTFKTKEFVKEYLIPKHNIILLHDRLYLYKDDTYVPNRKAIEQLLVEICSFKKSQINEILYYLALLAPEVEEYSNCYIAFENGLLPFETGMLTPYNPEYIVTGSKLPFSYPEQEPSNPVVDQALNILCRKQ